MKAFFEGNILRLVPEGQEQAIIQERFPDSYLKTSKVIKVKHIVDGFGKPTADKYLEIKGYSPRKSVAEDDTSPEVPGETVEVSGQAEAAPVPEPIAAQA